MFPRITAPILPTRMYVVVRDSNYFTTSKDQFTWMKMENLTWLKGTVQHFGLQLLSCFGTPFLGQLYTMARPKKLNAALELLELNIISYAHHRFSIITYTHLMFMGVSFTVYSPPF